MKAHILIVEDESILYERIRRKLVKENYSVEKYTPSFEDAISKINNKTPDIVLLDIDLDGDKTGIDLGKVLNNDFKIPFIYLTQLDDDETFFRGLHTNHEHFIVKTKPRLNIQEVLRAIQTVIKKHEVKKSVSLKEGVMGLVGYLDEIKEYNKGSVSRVPIRFEDIVFFTVKSFINENNEEEDIRTNYLWFETKTKDYYFLKSSLKDLLNILPYNFVRINESYIVNIAPGALKGRINGTKLNINNRELIINSTYKDEVKNRLEKFYF